MKTVISQGKTKKLDLHTSQNTQKNQFIYKSTPPSRIMFLI